MRNINWISAVFALCVTTTAMATVNTFIVFTTIQEAEQYCPANTDLTFTATNPAIPHGAGTISGYNTVAFESIPPKHAIQPKNIDTNGIIQDAQFSDLSGTYGHSSNGVVTCFYSYTAFTGATTYAALRG